MGRTLQIERDRDDPRIGWLLFDYLERRNAIGAEMWRRLPDRVRAFLEKRPPRFRGH